MTEKETRPQPLEDFLGRLEGVEAENGHYKACCPAHDDENPSLEVKWVKGKDEETVWFACRSQGCDKETILKNLGLGWSDLYVNGNGRSRNGLGELVATYDYTDPSGQNLLYQVLKYEKPNGDKECRIQRPVEGTGRGFARPDGIGQRFTPRRDRIRFEWGLGEQDKVLYRLPDVYREMSDPSPIIVIVEGEKDADNVHERLGFTATCNPGGAGKWDRRYSEILRGAAVVIIPDNDDPGRKHAQEVAEDLLGIAGEVSVLELPDLPDKGDVSDWIEARNSEADEEFDALINEALIKNPFISVTSSPIPPESDGNKSSLPIFTIAELREATEQEEAQDWTVPRFLRRGDLTLIGGEAKRSGKTTFILHALKAAEEGIPFLGEATQQTGSLILTEQGNNILEGIDKAGIREDQCIFFTPYRDVSKRDWSNLIEAAVRECAKHDLGILIVDTLVAFAKLRGSDENLVGEIRERMVPVLEAARVHNLAVGLVHHTGKDGKIRGSSHFAADPDIIWTIKRPEGEHAANVRMLEGLGRYDAVNTTFSIALEEGGYRFAASGAQVERTTALEALKEHVPVGKDNAVRETKIKDAISEETNISEPTIRRAIQDLVDQNVIVREQLREKGKPYVLYKRDGKRDGNKSGAKIINLQDKRDEKDLFPSDSEGKAKGVTEIKTERDMLRANEDLAEAHNLIYQDQDADRVRAWLRTLTYVSFDIETYGTAKGKQLRKKEALSFVRGQVRLIQLSDGETTYLLDTMFLSNEVTRSLLEELRGKVLYVHNGIFDLPRIDKSFGVDLLAENVRDTLVLSRLARTGELGKDEMPHRHDLESVLEREIGVEVAELGKPGHEWGDPLTEDRLRYAEDDVRHLPRLYERLMELIRERSLEEGLDLLMKAYPAYLRMQRRGVPFDKGLFNKWRKELQVKVDAALAEIQEHAPEHPEGNNWSWGNLLGFEDDPSMGGGRNGALRALSIKGIDLDNLQKATRAEYLRKHRGEAPLLDALDRYLKNRKPLSDTKDLLKLWYEDGRVYPNVKFASQESGRSAYSDPAIQNMAKEREKDTELSLRDCIRTPEGSKIIKADYAAQELRILAFLTEDEDLRASFTRGPETGKDPHMVVAERVASKELVRGTEEGERLRKLGKRVNFGFSYGAGAKRYAQSVYEDTSEHITLKQAKTEQEAFRESWPNVYDWQQTFGSRTGAEPDAWFTTSFFGRRRYVGIRNGKPNYCDRLNGPVQAGGADMLYLAVSKLLEDKEQGLFKGCEILLTTHDEIVLEVPEESAREAESGLCNRMREALRELIGYRLATEDCVEVEVGPSWGGK